MARFALAMVAVFLLAQPTPVLADAGTSAWNAAFVLQAVDTFQSQTLVNTDNISGGCHHLGFERDPLAAPFTHSIVTGIAVAAAVNILGRLIFRHSLGSGIVFGGVEAAAVINNARVSHIVNGPCT